MRLFTDPAVRLADELEFVVVNAHGADGAFAGVEDFVTLGRAFAGDGGRLVVTVKMVLVSAVAEGPTLEQLFSNARFPGRREEGRHPVQASDDSALDPIRRHITTPP